MGAVTQTVSKKRGGGIIPCSLCPIFQSDVKSDPSEVDFF
jgi:hypothetical protein